MDAARIVGAAVGVVVIAAGVGLFAYRDANLHADERLIENACQAGFEEKQAQVGGATINYGEGPDNGPAVLLVHGQGMEWEDYAQVLPELSKNHHVFAVDCFGHGESDHDAALYSCKANGDALIAFASQVIGQPYTVSGHSSGGVLAAYVAANDPANVQGCVLEDPPFFSVLPEEVQEGAGTFVWFDGYTPAHEYVESGSSEPYAAFYAQRSYLFGMFGGLKDKLVADIRTWCKQYPDQHVVTPWIPQSWTRGTYFMDDYDPRFGDAFYTGSWMDGIDQEALLGQIACNTVYLKAETNYGEDGMLYAANTDDDAQRLVEAVPHCEMRTVKSGHDIHYEKPDFFASAINEV